MGDPLHGLAYSGMLRRLRTQWLCMILKKPVPSKWLLQIESYMVGSLAAGRIDEQTFLASVAAATFRFLRGRDTLVRQHTHRSTGLARFIILAT